jgi:hypothetical protein
MEHAHGGRCTTCRRDPRRRRGRRIGGRKAFVELGGRPLLAHVIERIGPQVSRLAINAAPDPGFDPFDLPVLPDVQPDCGPLGGDPHRDGLGAGAGRGSGC